MATLIPGRGALPPLQPPVSTADLIWPRQATWRRWVTIPLSKGLTLRGILAILACSTGFILLADASEPRLSGRFSLDYVPRWLDGTNTGDQDVYMSLLVDWGGPPDRFSGSVYLRGVKDIDGASASASSRFLSTYDAYGDGWFSQLFYAYADIRSVGLLSRARVGRQYLYQGQPFHFDGLRLLTRRGTWGLRATLFGGIPVHYFEESSGGDWLAGLGIEMRPWPGGKLNALYAHVEDDARFAGLPATSERVDDLFVVSAGSRLAEWGSALIRYTAVDAETRDVLLRAQASLPARSQTLGGDKQANGSALHVSLTYYAQPRTLAEFTTDLSVYSLVEGVSHPYDRIDLSVAKGFRTGNGWRVAVEARGAQRRLWDPADEGEYNRDYDLLWLGVGLEAPDRRRLSAELGQAWWRSSGNVLSAFDAELRWRPNEKLRVSLGTSYSLYRYDLFSLSEQTDVRETFVRTLWKPAEHVELRTRYAAELYDGDLIHKMEMGCSVKF